ncbi:MAG: HD domain-containing phosphohydrolase [Bacillota bacterium]
MEQKLLCIDLKKFISSISLGLDLAEACTFRDRNRVYDFEVSIPGFSVYSHNFASHSKKTALISMFIAKKLDYNDEKLDNIYISSFLHDIGAVDAFSSCHADKGFIYEHCSFGSDILKKLPVDDKIPVYVKYHHEHYDGSGPYGLAGNEIPMESSIIHIADLFELMYRDDIPNIVQRKKIAGWFKEKSGRLFSPDVVDALLSAAESERFWLDIENINSDQDILDRIHPTIYAPVTVEKLMDIALVFAVIIDKKSTFTHQHSVGLTNHLSNFCSYLNYDEDKTAKMKIAGLLHDLGKLSVPEKILDKPGKLTVDEYTIIRSHTYYTKLILDKINGMELISKWASNHHETLRGTGYPEKLSSDELCTESRILAVCDIYQALTENRPYRPGMSKKDALTIIDNLVYQGDIDKYIAGILKEII